MKILKILDGFVTNSSSDSATILIALRKGHDFKKIIDEIGLKDIPASFMGFFKVNDEEEIKKIGEFVEVDHLLDEYDLLENTIPTQSWGDEEYEIPIEEFGAICFLTYFLKENGGNIISVVDFTESRVAGSGYKYGTRIAVALKKGVNLGDMLEKIGLSSEYKDRFVLQSIPGTPYYSPSYLSQAIKGGYFNENIFEFQKEYDILFRQITTDSFHDAYATKIDRSDFRKKFFDELTSDNNIPKKLVGNDFILLHSITNDLKYFDDKRERLKKKIKDFIDDLINQ